MSVYDFCLLCTDDSATVRIYDMNDDVEKEVFTGEMRDAMYSDYEDYEVESFDLCTGGEIILNIDTTEEDEK